jgi:hypothetical protein
MERKIELLNVPSIEQISEEWKAVLMTAPKIVHTCSDVDKYGSLIFRRTYFENVRLDFELLFVEKRVAKDIVVPELAAIIPGRHVVVFGLLSPDQRVDVLIYVVFNKKCRHVQYVFCYEMRNGINKEVKSIRDLEEYLNIVLRLSSDFPRLNYN